MENTENKKKGSRKWLLLLFLLLFFLFAFFFSKSSLKTNPKINNNAVPDTKITTSQQEPTAKIIKCQNTIVTPKVTTELFAYVSGNKTKLDYRIGATTEEDSFMTQILYDGQWVYIWNPAIRFDNNQKTTNPPGLKMKTTPFNYEIDLTKLNVVDSLSDGSGDRLCKEWDDVDPVFEIPSDIEFKESSETQNKIKNDLDKICQTCEQITNSSVNSTCRKNLGCQ
ncbi:MAG: hypothetical protein A2857_04090 [Candidatus Levybacteria bacterium RIFCSPHIGHO2_01_FULL_36_15]|nr:MAG: hypothetical protein A2857_04090 [Candidatus Levybacteria bacterium RIFCSPHIGHO2_01_FULL_36_15]OGH37436.1 MAG: hypothetical protein A2905_04865 [Candidatus Levybacteria bacterium RIFCSPLOWO2_01_FULL_36_10]